MNDDFRYYVMNCLGYMSANKVVETSVVKKRYETKQESWKEWDKIYKNYLTKDGKVLIAS